MRAPTPAILALAALLLAPALPAQATFHGVAWDATGVATDGVASWRIDIAWGGEYGGAAANVFVVTLTDPVTGHASRVDVLGYELYAANSVSHGDIEVLFMSGTSPDPSVQFTISGPQVANIRSQTLDQVLTGNVNGISFTVATLNYAYEV